MVGRSYQGRGTEIKLPAPKSQPHFFRNGWRKGISVHRGATLCQMRRWALYPHLYPFPQQLYEAGPNHLHFREEKTGAQGLGRAGLRHLAGGAAPEYEAGSSDFDNHNPSAAPAASFSRPRARVPGARGPVGPKPRPGRGFPGDALTVRTSCPAAPASPSSGPPRSAPPGPRGCSASPVAPMAPPVSTSSARLCHRLKSLSVTSLERAARSLRKRDAASGRVTRETEPPRLAGSQTLRGPVVG